jgi:hypothetical protein
MQHNRRYPLRHLSVRVPWHDHGWDGTVCQDPKANGACLVLRNCSLKRNDAAEAAVAGKRICCLKPPNRPVCVDERGAFMADCELEVTKGHPYHDTCPEQYGHFKPTTIRLPRYSAPAVPFYWLLRENARGREADNWNPAKEGLVERLGLDYDHGREPNLSFETDWVQEARNQRALCNGFFEHLEPEKSLCFFYAKQVPFVEEAGRVLVGVGRVLHVADGVEYQCPPAAAGLRTMLWEHPVQHSIRPDFVDGFVLPYQAAMAFAAEHEDFDPACVAVLTPPEKQFEFSYASEHVTCDTAIQVLLRCVTALRIAEENRIGRASWQDQIQWCHDRINELERIRGSYPGLGSALCAFGLRQGHFVARAIVDQLSNDADPWPLVERMFGAPSEVLPPELAGGVKLKHRTKFGILRGKPLKYDLLQMLSRFEINQEQAKLVYRDDEYAASGIEAETEDFLRNPYLLYEATRHLPELAIPLSTVEMGIFRKDAATAFAHTDSGVELDDATNGLRIRALTVQELAKAADLGHTLLPRAELVRRIRKLPLRPPCELDTEDFEVADEEFGLALRKVAMADGQLAYQLGELAEDGNLIRATVNRMVGAARLAVVAEWRRLVDQAIARKKPDGVEPSAEDTRAREEKAVALGQLAQSRFSVLIGPAGTGKTTLIDALCSIPEVKAGGILLLAPTGKARVRLEQVAQEAGSRAQTLAQFLLGCERYDLRSQRYVRNPEAEQYQDAATVIVDESSMLTEPMLAALLDALKDVKRLVLVGDHRQLPPIGPGRPFFDVVRQLEPTDIAAKPVRVGPGYCELTVKMRQGGGDREDLQLAEWFSGNAMAPGDDDIFARLTDGFESPYLRVVCWQDEAEFAEIFEHVLVEELDLGDIGDVEKFDKTLGGETIEEKGKRQTRFNWGKAAKCIEGWQLLCPIRNRPVGVNALNRRIHELFRSRQVAYAQSAQTWLPKPFGPQAIVYGDKVINNRNMRRSKKVVHPEGGLNYIANGELGIVVGRWRRHDAVGESEKPHRPKQLEVEFSSQVGFRYLFDGGEFKEEGDIPLELAYALTVHKSQGSQFKTVFLVVPQPCFLLKREMLYTALTRQEDRVVLLLQGQPRDLRQYAGTKYSDTAQRVTNLLQAPQWVEVGGRFFEEGLIHCAADHTMLRSKSELVIYEHLLGLGLRPAYEKELALDGQERYPDFTLELEEAGVTVYWEHCGMLHDEAYRRRWEKKREWYVRNGVALLEEATGQKRVLAVSRDSAAGAISIPEIDELIGRIRRYATA